MKCFCRSRVFAFVSSASASNSARAVRGVATGDDHGFGSDLRISRATCM